MVGLVRDQDRRGMAARHRRAGLPRATRLPARRTTWPSAPFRPTCWPRTGPTRSAPAVSLPPPGRSLGVATEADLAAYHGLPRPLVREVVAVHRPRRGRSGRAGRNAPTPIRQRWHLSGTRARGRTVLLSPFDSLIWYRERVERLFGLRHRLEAYTPKAKRVYGYFAMPVLAGTRIVGLVDPGRQGRRARGQAGDALASGRHRATWRRHWWRRRRGSAAPGRRRESGSRLGEGRSRGRRDRAAASGLTR